MTSKRYLTNAERKKYLHIRRNFKGTIIGITGNIGKSSSLHMLYTILKQKGNVLKPKNDYGTLKSNIEEIERLDNRYDYALFEFDNKGRTNFAEILRLIKPNVGIVTNFGDSHLNYLGGMVKIALKKSEVVKYLARDGVAIFNKDDEMTAAITQFIETDKIVKYGFNPSAEFFAGDIKQLGPKGISFKLNGQYTMNLPLYSVQDVYNFLAATAAAQSLGISLDDISDSLNNHFQLQAGHGRLHQAGKTYIIDESYYATPQSLSKAARSLIGFKTHCKPLIFIVGDMAAAGINVEDQHLNMGYFLSALPINHIITIGEYAKYISKGAELIRNGDDRVHHARDTNDVIHILNQYIRSGAAVTIKGVGPVSAHRIINYIKEKYMEKDATPG
ncbi:MAG: hypothetical protein GF313_15830 [Caldithrix sp.]|nr:hypothetical protein [Caldithrix sp.]